MMADLELIEQLLIVARDANPPDVIGVGEFEDRALFTTSGWTLVVFYDCGDLDYIDHFVSPSGQKIDVWGDDADPRIDDRSAFGSTTLQSWRGVADTDRLLRELRHRAGSQ